jgi:hypothetical protein
LSGQDGLGGENYREGNENELADFWDKKLIKVNKKLFAPLWPWEKVQNWFPG